MTTLPKNAASGKEPHQKSSARFDRRRFIRTSMATTPLLMSVKSPMAWASEACTASVYASGNASHVHDCTMVLALSHGSWKVIIPDDLSGLPRGRQAKRDYWRPLILAEGYSGSSQFFDVFLTGYDAVQTKSKQSGTGTWKFQLLNPDAQPTFEQGIFEQQYPVVFRIWDSENPGNQCVVDFSYSQTTHLQLITAFLNGLLSDSMLDYPFSELDVVAALRQAIDKMIDSIIASCDASPSDISSCTFTTNEWQLLADNPPPLGLNTWG